MPSHLVDFWGPFDLVALPRVFFHANGNVEIEWSVLFAAILANERCRYRRYWRPGSFNIVNFYHREALTEGSDKGKETGSPMAT